MKAVITSVTILCIANVICGLRSLEPSAGAALDRFLGKYRNTNWAFNEWALESINAVGWINANPGAFQSKVNAIPKSYITPLWDFCRKSDGTIHRDQLNWLIERIYGSIERTPEAFIMEVREFVKTQWRTFDKSQNGLDFDEFKNLITMLAAIEARVYIQGFDDNLDFQLSGYEIANWWNSKVAWWTHVYGKDNDVVFAAKKAAFKRAQVDGNELVMSKFELTKFIIDGWATSLV